MAGGFSLDLSSLNPLIDRLQAFPDRLRPELSAALRAGAQIIRSAERANIHNVTGALSKSVKIKVGNRKAGLTRMTVTTSGSDNLFTGSTYYGGMVEFGHKIGSRKLGKARRDVAPHPFLGKAIDEKGPQALGAIEASLIASLNKLGGGP